MALRLALAVLDDRERHIFEGRLLHDPALTSRASGPADRTSRVPEGAESGARGDVAKMAFFDARELANARPASLSPPPPVRTSSLTASDRAWRLEAG